MGEKATLIIIRLVLIVSFLFIFARLFELQIIKGKYYRELSDGNRIRRVILKAPRGEIFARGGEKIVTNTEVNGAIFYSPEKGYFISVEGGENDQKISAIPIWRREYPLSSSAAHITGYLGLVGQEEVKKIDAGCIEKGQHSGDDLVGRSGIEEVYDCMLRGYDGEKLIEVLADGTYVRDLGERPPIAGETLKTSIDYPLQEYVSTLLGEKRGVVLVSNARGEILSLYSSPSFNPNDFRQNPESISKLFDDKNMPFFNRVISGKYAPGSIFKPVVGISALESGAIDRSYRYVDTGAIHFSTLYGDYSYSNWYYTQYGGVEGEIDLSRAIARSTDTFFYKVGELTGIEDIVDWSKKFGLAEKTGIDLPGEIGGLVPDPKWKEEVKGERWFLGNTYHFSIGQGDLAITPIGIHTAIEAIANGGMLCRPHIKSDPEVGSCKDLKIKKVNISPVKEGMKKACSSGGTGYTFFDFEGKKGIDVGCKTGTAQIGGQESTHSWFTAFAPVNDPEIVVTVLVEEGGEGSKVAGPIARQIFDFWFKDKAVFNPQ